MVNRRGIEVGMVVHSSDGHRLGRVVAVADEQFQVEKGLFFPREYLAAYSDVAKVDGRDVRLIHGRDQLVERELANNKGMENVGDSDGALGELGRARMERYHDVIGAVPTHIPMESEAARPAIHAAPDLDADVDRGDVVRRIGVKDEDELTRS